jgi:hypothetical protein
MRAPFKNPLNSFAPVFLVLMAIFVFGFGCNTSKPETDPLAGWTLRGFDDYLPSLQQHHYHLDKAITDDYQDFVKKNELQAAPVTGFYEDGTGQHAIRFEAFPRGQNASWQYVLIYDKESKRIKVLKYGYDLRQS